MTQVKVSGNKKNFDVFLTVGFVTLGLIFQLLLNLQINQIALRGAQVPIEKARKLEPQLFEVFSFGQLPILIDWIWIQCMLDSSNDPAKKGEHSQLYYDLDLITNLDPSHFPAYEIGANLLAIARNDGIGARDLLLKAERWIQLHGREMKEGKLNQHWEKIWKIYLLQGYVYLFELNDLPHAAEAFIKASQENGAPTYLESLAKRLQSPGGYYEVGIRLVNALLLSDQDSRSREELEKKRSNLLIGQYLFEKNFSFREYLKKQPGTQNIKSSADLTSHWRNYLKIMKISELDPWGGRLSVNQSGMVVSTTPHESVFGLE